MKTSWVLSLISFFLALAATMLGLFHPDLYQDNAFVRTAWKANDAVTLGVVLPLLIISLWQVRRGNVKVQLLWMGLLVYLMYNYAFYLFGAVFNAAFLLYLAIFTLTVFALIYGLSDMPVLAVQAKTNRVRWVIPYLLLIVLILLMVELVPAAQYIFTGQAPEIIITTEHSTSVVYALDLSIVVPLSILAIGWLWKKRPWGYVLTIIMLVKGATYGLVLVTNTLALRRAQTGDDPLLPFYTFVALGGMLGLMYFLSRIQVTKRNPF